MTDGKLWTRRKFLKLSALASLGGFLPEYVVRSANAISKGVESSRDLIDSLNDRILVVVQLGGGNDGLNTIVPVTNDEYYKVRPRIAVPKSKTLRLESDFGFHQKLTGLKELYDRGSLAVVNGVGYPNPDRSHFRSMEIWQTASDANRFERHGWIGRYFDNCCGADVSAVSGVNIGPELAQSFSSSSGSGVAFELPQMFRWVEGAASDKEGLFEKLNQPSAQKHKDDSNLDFLRHVTADALVSSSLIQKAARYKRQAVQYPPGRFGRDLRTIANMIAGGLPTRIYYVSLTGFDTHANQAGLHERLLEQFSEGMLSFYADLQKIGVMSRTMIMCFSEFGRRVEENASAGTDHGTAGPMFIIGDKINPGVYGRYPSLTRLDQGDLQYTVDFRSVYATILQNWLMSRPELVLNRKFSTLDFV